MFILNGNPSFYLFFGSNEAKWKPLELQNIIPDDFDDIVSSLRIEGAAIGKEVSVQMDDKEITGIFSMWPVKDASQKTAYYHALIHDISDRLHLDTELKRIEKMTMTARLTRSIGHEIRNPLNNINLALEALSSELKPSGTELTYFDIIQRNVERISRLIRELLESSKPAAIDAKEISVEDITESVIRSTIDRFRLRNIDLETKIAIPGLRINVDPEKLRIALSNLVINALEAIEDDQGKVYLEIIGREKDVCFNVIDNGKGMSEEEQKVLFDPFYTSKKGGVGLGLTITQNIIAAHKGNLEVESKKNVGTTFSLSLPKDEILA